MLVRDCLGAASVVWWILGVVCVGADAAEDARSPGLRTIIERNMVWARRVRSCRYTYVARRLVPRDSLEILAPSMEVTGSGPHDDVVIEDTYTVLLDGHKVKLERDGLAWHDGRARFEPIRETYVLIDGIERALIELPDAKTGVVSEESILLNTVPYRVVLWAYRLFDPVLGAADPDEVTLAGTAYVEGHRCVVVEKRNEDLEPVSVDQWWLAEDDGRLLRWQLLLGDREPYWQIDMQYEDDDEVGRRLTGWRITETRANGKGESRTSSATDITLNEAISADLFEVVFPHGTRVTDWVVGVVYTAGDDRDLLDRKVLAGLLAGGSKEEFVKKVEAETGEQRPAVAGDSTARSAEPGHSGAPWLNWLLLGCAVLVAVGVGLALRKRKAAA